MYKILGFCLFIFSSVSYGVDDECKYFKYCGSNSTTSSAQRSSPTIGAAGRTNPAIISKIKGLGIESIFQKNNPVEFNLVTGNGKFGGMISSSSAENSFFGNRTIELDDDFLYRSQNEKRYKNNKLHLALGAGIIEKKYLDLNLGISGIRNKDTKKTNLGYAISGRLAFLNFGFYKYKDDIKLTLTNHYSYRILASYEAIYGVSTYQEAYDVSVYTFGTRFYNLSLDAALLNTKYDFYRTPVKITILSSSLAIKKFLFNYAYRKEYSDSLQYKKGKLIYTPEKVESYAGIQYLPNKHLLVGGGYNNYLLNEVSMTMTLFM